MLLSRRQLLQLTAAGAAGGGLSWLGLGQTPSAAAPSHNPDLRIGLISDLNSSYGATTYIPQVSQGLQQLLALQPALVVCAGDMVAGQKPGLSASQLDAMWEGFTRTVLQPVRQAGRPFLPAVGNHDGSPGFEADRAAVRRFWTPRRQALGLRFVDIGDFPFHYSAVQNDVLYVGLDATAWQAAPNMSTMRYLTSTATVSGELNLLL